MDPGAAADLQADTVAPAQQGIQGGADAERISARGGGAGQELLLIPVRDLVICCRQRHHHAPWLLAQPG